ncbi:MAG: DUF2306 domain-containing protein [Hyphomicrobiales bacterium]
MTFELLLTEPQPIPPHAIAAIAAFLLGIVQFMLPKGTTRHRLIGYVWVSLMVLVAASGLFIFKIRLIGPFSPIHLISIFTLVSLFFVVRAARVGDIARHKSGMKQLFGFGLVLAGAFTFLPGRAMHAVLFGG